MHFRLERSAHASGVTRLATTVLLSVWSAAAPALAKPRPVPLAGLDAYAARAMREFGVPGMAVAVVKDGGDDPVTKHLPAFQMYDPWVTREISVRDLVTHRTGLGLGEGDLMWWPPTTFTRAEIVRGMRWLKPASSLRSRYAYNNVAFVAAGEVVAAASGSTWDAFVRERILRPLGMSRTTSSLSAAEANRAAPHLDVKGVVVPVAPMDFGNAGAAASLQSSASDMARSLAALIECGRGNEAPTGSACVLKPASIRQMWLAQTVQGTPPGLEPTRAGFVAYGLGFGLRDYRGRKVVGHTGGLPGYVSQVALVPEDRLGLVVLTNQEETGAFEAVKYRVFDQFLGAPAPPVDWIAAFRNRAGDQRKKAEGAVAKAAASRDAASPPSLALARYAGRYRDPWYGEASISEEGGRLVLDMTRTPGMIADLEHWQHDTFVARWRRAWMSDESPADAYLSFTLMPDASIERMTMAPVSPAIDFSFDYQDLLFAPVPADVTSGRTP